MSDFKKIHFPYIIPIDICKIKRISEDKKDVGVNEMGVLNFLSPQLRRLFTVSYITIGIIFCIKKVSASTIEEITNLILSEKYEIPKTVNFIKNNLDNAFARFQHMYLNEKEYFKDKSLSAIEFYGVLFFLLLNKEISIYKEEGQSDRFFDYIKSLSECDYIIKSLSNGTDQKLIKSIIQKEKSKGGQKTAFYWKVEKEKIYQIWKDFPPNTKKKNKLSLNQLCPKHTTLSHRKLEEYIREWRKTEKK